MTTYTIWDTIYYAFRYGDTIAIFKWAFIIYFSMMMLTALTKGFSLRKFFDLRNKRMLLVHVSVFLIVLLFTMMQFYSFDKLHIFDKLTVFGVIIN